MLEDVKARLLELTDDDLFELLDAVSEEVKRRNGLLGGPTIPDIRGQTPEANLKMVLEALGELGVRIKTRDGQTVDMPQDPSVKP